MNTLYFGDSNTSNYMGDLNCTVDKNDGLCMSDMFDFLFLSALDCDIYTRVVISIGTNDSGHGLTKEELQEKYRKIHDIYKNAVIVGPYGDIDTKNMETTDGIHFTEKTKECIGRLLDKYYND